MTLQGLHHITSITADARANVAFHADLRPRLERALAPVVTPRAARRAEAVA